MEANIKPSLEDDEIKEYMKLTLEEIKASKKNHGYVKVRLLFIVLSR